MRTVADLPAPPGLPLLGHAPALARGQVMHRRLQAWSDTYGPTYRIRLGPATAVVTSAPELVDTVLRRRPETFRRATYLSDVIDELGGHGLFNAEGDDWRRLRRTAVPGLSVASLRNAFDTISRSTGRLRDAWAAAGPETRIPVLRDLMLYTLEVIVSLTVGHDLDAIRRRDEEGLHTRLPLIASGVTRRMYAPVPYWRWFRLPADRRLDAVVAETRALISEHYRRPRAGESPACYLDTLTGHSEEEAVSAVLNMIVAGEDNTAALASWAMHYLATRPELQEKVRAEVTEMPGDATALSGLRFTADVVEEVMRAHPVSPFAVFEAAADTTIADQLRVDRGTVLILMLTSGGTYAPFGGGPRFCPGRSLALVETAMVVAMACHHFTIEPDTSAGPVGERTTLSVFPTRLGVRLRPRR